MTKDRAFKVLGIEPTVDHRAIRNAFVRLARIYHPDRFAGLPSDVRTEAERRMKEVSVAYETLRTKRGSIKIPPAKPPRSTRDAWEQAKRFRDEVEARRVENDLNRARWQKWDELEQEARQRAEWEADLAAKLAEDLGGVYAPTEPEPSEPEPAAPRPKSLLLQRLEQAGMDPSAPLPARRSAN